VGTAQKVPRRLVLRATGTSGHGSIPRIDNPIVHLSSAVAKAGTWETPARLNDTTREFFRRLATISPSTEAADYRNIEDPAVQHRLRDASSPYYSMLRTSIVPTLFHAGIKDNVIPAGAEATLDVRALPDEEMTALIEKLKARIDDPLISIEREDWDNTMPPSPPARIDTAMFAALERAQRKLYPAAITVPVMGTGANDSAFLLARGVQSYGVRMTDEMSNLMRVHGNDERASVPALGSFVEYVYSAVTDVAASR
jgi:acetylornithine deacetylase/succinyl-diaminopimelate desuccinylase-like protein